jgi:hypothetical protein
MVSTWLSLNAQDMPHIPGMQVGFLVGARQADASLRRLRRKTLKVSRV